MSYYSKYLKYKFKYIKLKQLMNNISMSGGKVKKMTWDQKRKARVEELAGLKSTKSFVPVEKLSSRNRTYLIHDNGGQPFKVVANKDGLVVYKHTDDDNDDEIYEDVVLEFGPNEFLGYWYGFDSSPYEMHGNSILIKVTDNQYISVGWNIYQFDTDEKIKDYVSPVGNSDVPYPVAYGSEYVYFMLDEKKIKKSDLEFEATVANAEDLYGEFFGHLGSKKATHVRYPFDNVVILQERLMD